MISRSTDIRAALRSRQRGFLLNPFRFGAPAPASSFRYWSLDISNNDGDATYTSMATWSLMDGSVDRALSYVAGSPSQSTYYSSDKAVKLFDNNIGTEWVTAGGSAKPSWVSVDLGASYALTSYKIASQRAVTGRTPTAWVLRGSNASQTGPWTDVHAVSSSTGWGIQETRTFTI